METELTDALKQFVKLVTKSLQPAGHKSEESLARQKFMDALDGYVEKKIEDSRR